MEHWGKDGVGERRWREGDKCSNGNFRKPM